MTMAYRAPGGFPCRGSDGLGAWASEGKRERRLRGSWVCAHQRRRGPKRGKEEERKHGRGTLGQPLRREEAKMLGWDEIDSDRWLKFGSQRERKKREIERCSRGPKKMKARRLSGNGLRKMNFGLD